MSTQVVIQKNASEGLAAQKRCVDEAAAMVSATETQTAAQKAFCEQYSAIFKDENDRPRRQGECLIGAKDANSEAKRKNDAAAQFAADRAAADKAATGKAATEKDAVASASVPFAAGVSDWRSLAASSAPSDRKLVTEIQKMKWWEACAAWGREERAAKPTKRADALRWFLESERMITGKDRGHVHDRTVDIGMTECGVFAAKGMPRKVNQTTTAAGRSAQFVYDGMYVYTEPSPLSVGVVRAIQH